MLYCHECAVLWNDGADCWNCGKPGVTRPEGRAISSLAGCNPFARALDEAMDVQRRLDQQRSSYAWGHPQ